MTASRESQIVSLILIVCVWLVGVGCGVVWQQNRDERQSIEVRR